MRRNFEMPEMTVSMFKAENILTISGDIRDTATYKKTLENLSGDGLQDKTVLFTY